jgi:hypothetical protein
MLSSTEAGRPLLEEDQVRVLSGPHRGKVAMVVGYRPLSPSPIVVYHRERSLFEGVGASEVLSLRSPSTLEPLPEVSSVLNDSVGVHTCGSFLSLGPDEKGITYTFVPLESKTDLKKVYEEGGVSDLLEYSFVTRLPHLVMKASPIDRLLEGNLGADESVDCYLSQEE